MLPVSLIVGFPAAIYFATAAIPVAIVFLSRRRARVAEVPALSLWERVGRPVEPRSFASLLKRLISLLMQLLVVGGLVFALADPWPMREAARRTVIVLDVSATMQTLHAGADRMTDAKQRAKSMIAALSPDGEVAIMLAGHSPELALPPTNDRKAALVALDAVTSWDVEGDLSAALRAASAFVDDPRYTDLVVISDFAAERPDVIRASWNAPGRLRVIAVGQDSFDVAVTDLRTESQPPTTQAADGERRVPSRLRVVAMLTHRGMEGRSVPVRLLLDDSIVDSRNIVLSGRSTSVEFNGIAAPPGARLKFQVDAEDGLAVDDVAFAVTGANSQVDVYLVSGSGSSVERAIRADAALRLQVVRKERFRADDTVAKVVIVNGDGMTTLDPSQALGKGYLFIATADPFGWSWSDKWADTPSITHWSGDHPAIGEIDPLMLHVIQDLRIEWSTAQRVETLVAAGTVPVIAERIPEPPVGGKPRCIYWMFNPELPEVHRATAFPLLMWNTIDYLAGRVGDPSGDVTLTGRPLKFAAQGQRQVISPSGKVLKTGAGSAMATIYETNEQGIYTCQMPESSEEHRAVNLFSSRGTKPLSKMGIDSDEGNVGNETSPIGFTSIAAWGKRFARAAWQSVVVGLLGLGLIEWLLFHHRIVKIG